MVFSEAPGLADGYAGTIPADSGKNNQKVGYIIAIHRVRFDISTGRAGFHNPDREGYVDTALWVLVKSALLRLLPLRIIGGSRKRQPDILHLGVEQERRNPLDRE